MRIAYSVNEDMVGGLEGNYIWSYPRGIKMKIKKKNT